MTREIIKVQLPVWSTGSMKQALIYNEDRSHEGIIELTEGLEKLLQGQLKSFWWATWNKGVYDIVEPAPWQDW